MTLTCYCGCKLDVALGDYEECPNCYTGIDVPETKEALIAWNKEIETAIAERRYTGRIKIIAVDELGHEKLLRVVEDEGIADLVMAGYKMNHPEWLSVFTERELRIGGMQCEL